jgi:hypothetical protein
MVSMSTGKKMPPNVPGYQHKPLQLQDRRQVQKPFAVQPKMAAAQPSRQPPAAPPVYKPQPAPKVLQSKVHTHVRAVNQSVSAAPVPRPVNHPQPALKNRPPERMVDPRQIAVKSYRQAVAPPARQPVARGFVQPKISAQAKGLKSPNSSPAQGTHATPKVLLNKRLQSEAIQSSKMVTGRGTIQQAAKFKSLSHPAPPRHNVIMRKHEGNVTPDDRPVPSKTLTQKALDVRERERPADLDAWGQYGSEAIFSGGLIYMKRELSHGPGLSTMKAQLVNSKVIYVLTTDDTLYIRPEPSGIMRRQDDFTHANFTGGKSVKAAGQLFIRDGKVIRIDNESGHYMPSGNSLRHILKKLNREGTDLTKALLVMNKGEYDYEAYDAHEYILGQKNKVDDAEWRNQEVKFDAHTQGKDWNRKPVAYW